jgi:hypothetical protein
MRRGLFAVRIGPSTVPKVMVRVDDPLPGVEGWLGCHRQPSVEVIPVGVDGSFASERWLQRICSLESIGSGTFPIKLDVVGDVALKHLTGFCKFIQLVEAANVVWAHSLVDVVWLEIEGM